MHDLAQPAMPAMPARPAPLRLDGWPLPHKLSLEGLPQFLLPGLRPPATRRAWLDARQPAARAREFTRRVMQSWALGVLAEDATLVVSELVTNALRHGAQEAAQEPGGAGPAGIELLLCRRAGLMACAVLDPSAEFPLLVPAEHTAENGRGLQVVEALSAAWGWARLVSQGKAVWAILRIPATDAGPRGRERHPLGLALPAPAVQGSGIVRRRGQPQPDRYQRPACAVPHGVAGPRPGNVQPARVGGRP